MKSAQDRVHPLWDGFCQDLESASSLGDLSDLRDKYLGRKNGLISLELKKLGGLSSQERAAVGQLPTEADAQSIAELRHPRDLDPRARGRELEQGPALLEDSTAGPDMMADQRASSVAALRAAVDLVQQEESQGAEMEWSA